VNFFSDTIYKMTLISYFYKTKRSSSNKLYPLVKNDKDIASLEIKPKGTTIFGESNVVQNLKEELKGDRPLYPDDSGMQLSD